MFRDRALRRWVPRKQAGSSGPKPAFTDVRRSSLRLDDKSPSLARQSDSVADQTQPIPPLRIGPSRSATSGVATASAPHRIAVREEGGRNPAPSNRAAASRGVSASPVQTWLAGPVRPRGNEPGSLPRLRRAGLEPGSGSGGTERENDPAGAGQRADQPSPQPGWSRRTGSTLSRRPLRERGGHPRGSVEESACGQHLDPPG